MKTLEEAEELLREAAAIFRAYEGLHRQKGTLEGNAKAVRNAMSAEKIERFLAEEKPWSALFRRGEEIPREDIAAPAFVYLSAGWENDKTGTAT